MGKQLDIVRELLPKATPLAILLNAQSEPARRAVSAEGSSAAARLGFNIVAIEVRSVEEIGKALEKAASEADALLVMADPMFNAAGIPDLAARASIPAMYGQRQAAEAGGLMSYGSDLVAIARRHAHFVDRVLRGAKPSDLPVEQPTKYDFVINVTAAKALSLPIPPSLLARADEVIE